MQQLTRKQIAELQALLEPLGLQVKAAAPKTEAKPETVKQILARSKWYRPPSLASLGKGCRSSAYGMTEISWERVKEDYRFPHKS